ncbi:hypothetical protein N9917_01550 [Deltaproteobacteria bacterium]|nr:hypothetical protein [Deltaproteobacteria bacterium]
MTYIKPHMAPSLERHELTVLLDTEEVKVYRMARPNDSAYRVQLTFTPEGIAIQGDVGLGAAQNGICSRLGKGLGWFRGRLSEDYLCSKFLSKTWQREVVTRGLDSWLSDTQGELETAIKEMMAEDELTREEALEEAKDERENVAAWTKIRAAWGDETSEKEMYEVGSGLLTDFWDYSLGYDYPLADAGWLCVIQQRFAALLSDLNTPKRQVSEETG